MGLMRLAALPLLLAAGCAAPGAGPARLGCDGILRVGNAATQAVEQLYVSAEGPAAWGADLLAPGTLPPGAEHAARSSARIQSVRVVFVDGTAAELMGIDVCATPRLTAIAGGLRTGG